MTASVGKLAHGLIPTCIPTSFFDLLHPLRTPFPKTLFLQSDVSTIVYFLTCVNRIFGNYHQDILHKKSLSQQAISLLHRAQYRVKIPPNVSQLCCGLDFASKGFPKSSEAKAAELEKTVDRSFKRRQISRLCGCFSLHVTYENCVSFSSLQKNYI
jgi:D-lactate dehydrogenase